MPEHPNPLQHQFSVGIKKILSSSGKTLLALVAIALVSLVIVLPAWFFSINYPVFYSWGILALGMGVALLSLLNYVLEATRKIGWKTWLKNAVFPTLLRKVPSYIIAILGVASLIFFILEIPAPAALFGLLFFLGLGIHLFR